jgi:hypothetical protein
LAGTGPLVIAAPTRIKRAGKTAAAGLGDSRAERQALVGLRFGAIRLKRPRTQAAKDLPDSVVLWVVDVREIDPPSGAEPVHWRLLTTHAVTTLAQAHQLVAWYRVRWTIEQVFRAEVAWAAHRGFAAGGSVQLQQACGDRPDRRGVLDAGCADA